MFFPLAVPLFWKGLLRPSCTNQTSSLINALYLIHYVIIKDHSSGRVLIHPSLRLWPTLYSSILCSPSSMPWQQIKLKPAWKKEALKCCHMQDCMGTSWGAHVVLGLSERCWVCVVYRVRLSMVHHSTMITQNSNSWMSKIFGENVISNTHQSQIGQCGCQITHDVLHRTMCSRWMFGITVLTYLVVDVFMISTLFVFLSCQSFSLIIFFSTITSTFSWVGKTNKKEISVIFPLNETQNLASS